MSLHKDKEWEIENALTSPEDRDHVKKNYKPCLNERKLSEEEVQHAMNELNNTKNLKNFLKVERRYADPVDPMQRIGLISFVPAKGATPNKNGLYGFAKLRGNYPTEREASEKAELIIREVDSYHQIYHCYVGRPFPITLRNDMAKETDDVDLQKDMNDTYREDIRKKKKEDEKIKREVSERAQRLQEDVKKETDDPNEVYTTLRVKKAQLIWAYLDYEKKINKMKDSIIKTRKEIKEMDSQNEQYKKEYFNRYKQARKDSGLDESKEDLEGSFMKYMVEDVDLGF